VKASRIIGGLFAISFCSLTGAQRNANAGIFVDTSGPGVAFSGIASLAAADITYDATSEIFTAVTNYSGPPDLLHFEALGGFGPTVVSGIRGTLILTSTIDHNGTVDSGIFSLVGTVPSLGIFLPQSLMSGHLHDDASLAPGATLPDGNCCSIGEFELIGSEPSFAPGLEAIFGPIDEVIFAEFTFETLNFTHDFGILTSTESPEIGLFNIPEPSTDILFAAGFLTWLGLGRTGRRRQLFAFQKSGPDQRPPGHKRFEVGWDQALNAGCKSATTIIKMNLAIFASLIMLHPRSQIGGLMSDRCLCLTCYFKYFV